MVVFWVFEELVGVVVEGDGGGGNVADPAIVVRCAINHFGVEPALVLLLILGHGVLAKGVETIHNDDITAVRAAN